MPHPLQVDDASFQASLLQAIREDPGYAAGSAKVMVFTKDTGAADKVSELLSQAGVE